MHFSPANAGPDDPHIPVDQAAEEYGLSKTTLFRWLREDRLERFRRLGDRRTHLDRHQLEALIQLRPVTSRRGRRPTDQPDPDQPR